MDNRYDLIIIGGGQSALACGYYLRRTNIKYLILDNQEQCGGTWLHTWESLTLFSPAEHSSLPGWIMPKSANHFPSKKEVVHYLCQYEKRHKIAVRRPVEVTAVTKNRGTFTVITNRETFQSRAIISATGTWHKPLIPQIPERMLFKGMQLHSAQYHHPEAFRDRKVLIVGEGNSGAQILAEVSKVAKTAWATAKVPRFMPDDVDGRVLFNVASAKYYAEKTGQRFDASSYNLGDIVMVPPVKDARQRDVLYSKGSFKEIYDEGVVWEHGSRERFDAIIWCTGFGYATGHLEAFGGQDKKGRIPTRGTRAVDVPGLWLVGYGNWTGFASATLIGVGRSARQTVKEVEEYIHKAK